MKKFGFGKKGDGDDDSNRSALFGSRSKNKSKPAENPYAAAAIAADPYAQAKLRAGVTSGDRGPSPSAQSGPPRSNGGFAPATPQGGYGVMNSAYSDDGKYQGADVKNGPGPGFQGNGGYGPDKLGAPGGYGSDRYEPGSRGQHPEVKSSKYGAGGYGGLGRLNSSETVDDNRDALFGGAKERVQQKTQHQTGYGQPPPYDELNGRGSESGAYGGGESQGYGAYDDRQLTQEEEEEEDVQATKQQIRFMKQEDVSSTRNALRIAAQAEESGYTTLARLGAQGERIHNTEKNLDLTANHNRVAEEKARELKQLNKSMFAVHVSNPFTATSRKQARDDSIMEKHRTERAQREATRRAGYESEQRLKKTFKELQPGDKGYSEQAKQSSLAERAKYQFEADEEDDEMENEIDSNLDALSGAASRLNGLARATGKEVDEQNRHLERINDKSTRVDDQIAMNRARLDRFH